MVRQGVGSHGVGLPMAAMQSTCSQSAQTYFAFVFVVAGHAGQRRREVGPVGVRVGVRCVRDMLATDEQEAGHEGVHEGAGQRFQQRVGAGRVCRGGEGLSQTGPYAVGDGGG